MKIHRRSKLIRAKLILAGFATALMLLSTACGGGNNQAAPPPPPAVPNPVPVVPGTNCGMVSGANPFSPTNTPYYAQLAPMQGMGGMGMGVSDTLTLTLGYLGTATPGQPNTPVVGSGSFNFADMTMMFSGGMPPSTSLPNTNICVSSQAPNNPSPFPGTLVYGPQGQMLSLTLYGVVAIPVMSNTYMTGPWGNIPGTPSATTQQAQVQISLGNGMQGGVMIQGSRIMGPVYITVQGPQGPVGPPMQYMAQ